MHIHDTSVPSWVDSDSAISFVSEVLKLEPMEFLARFEQWACARMKGKNCFILVGRILIKSASCAAPGEPADNESGLHTPHN